MKLERGDHLQRGCAVLTVLTVSLCGRYAVVAWAKDATIVEERIAVKGLRKARSAGAPASRRRYQDVVVIEAW